MVVDWSLGMSAASRFKDWQYDCRRVRRVVIDGLFSGMQCSCAAQRLVATKVARKARMSTARDLDANPVAAPETNRCWPESDRNTEAAIRFRCWVARHETQDAIAEIKRFARWVHIAEFGKE